MSVISLEESRKKFVAEYLKQTKSALEFIENELAAKIGKVTSILTNARDKGKKIFIMGNGGSASTASHFANDLAKLTIADGYPRFKVISLTDNVPVMLAWANDTAYENIFVEQLKNLMENEDIVIGISCSGNSMNVIKAVEYANSRNAITIGLSGFDGGKLLKTARENIHIPSFDMQKVEDMHLLVQHILTTLIREEAMHNQR